jgi:hypothetical protein
MKLNTLTVKGLMVVNISRNGATHFIHTGVKTEGTKVSWIKEVGEDGISALIQSNILIMQVFNVNFTVSMDVRNNTTIKRN